VLLLLLLLLPCHMQFLIFKAIIGLLEPKDCDTAEQKAAAAAACKAEAGELYLGLVGCAVPAMHFCMTQHRVSSLWRGGPDLPCSGST
jgi:hypothetical protein